MGIETIEYIRQKPEYAELVRLAYFEKDLPLNVERFMASDEWKETWEKVKQYKPRATSLLDVGCGAGFTSIAFALKGLKVSSLEPDPDTTIGYGAIKKLAAHFSVQVEIVPSYFEESRLPSESFDIVLCQAINASCSRPQNLSFRSLQGITTKWNFIYGKRSYCEQ